MPLPSIRIAACGLACLPLLLAGCGEINVRKYLPFTGDAPQERARTPANATEYQCAGNKRFFVRNLEGGAVWLILPDRELRLDRLGDSARYSKGSTVLELNAGNATLSDGASTFTGCKPAAAPAG